MDELLFNGISGQQDKLPVVDTALWNHVIDKSKPGFLIHADIL